MNNINKCCVCYKTDYETKINFKICHKVCLYCLQNMINKYNINNCPLCRKQYKIKDLSNKDNYDEYLLKEYYKLIKKYHKYNFNGINKTFENIDNSKYKIKSFMIY